MFCFPQADDFLGLYKQRGSIRAHLNWLECFDLHRQTKKYKNMKKRFDKVGFYIKRHKELGQCHDDETAEAAYRNSLEMEERGIEREYRPSNVVFNEKAVVNLTSIEIPEDIMIAISFGYKFLFPFNTNDSNIQEVLAQIEQTIEQCIPSGSRYEAYFEIAHILKKRNQLQNDPQLQWLTFINGRTERFLKMNKNVFATKSDKGGHSVIITVDEYRSKLTALLNDKNYTQSEEDPRERLIDKETKIVNILRKNCKTEGITKDLPIYEPNTLTLAKFYGLPKIHKKGVPLRPITATRGSPGYYVSKVFDIMLKEVFEYTDIHIKDSVAFKKYIDNLTIEEEDILISFDVVSMYTSIPHSLAKQLIFEKWDIFYNRYGIGKRILEVIIDFLLQDCTYFTALDEIFRQEEGLPMGNCISPTVARITMDRIVFVLLKEIPQITFIRVYVDDTITAMKEEFVMKALACLNNFMPNQIKFTMERENEQKQINFLNMTLKREGNFVITNWHRKGFASGRLLNYLSSHKRTTIINTAAHFIKTVLILSDPDFYKQNEPIIINTLRENCFPETTIIALMNECYTYMKPFFKKKLADKDNSKYRIFPQAICNSRSIKRIIVKLKKPGIKIAESTKNTKINPIRTFKTITPIEKKNNLIVTAKCVCGKKYKVHRTGHNETGEVVAKRICNFLIECSGNTHAYREVTFHRGLAYKSQTKHLEKYYRLKYKGKIDDHFFNLPIPAFARLVPTE